MHYLRARSVSAVVRTPDRPDRRIDRLIRRFPEPLRPDLQEAADRLLAVRSLSGGVEALQQEVEHVLRISVPAFIRYPTIKRPGRAKALVASVAAIAAAVEEGDELLTVVSVGTLAAPGLGTVMAVNLLATATEAWAATSVRVNQLVAYGRPVRAEQVAADLRDVMFGPTEDSTGPVSLVRRVAEGGARRLARRWAVGAVPVFGIVYGGFDASRTVDRMLRLPLPPRDEWET